jgi:hypothetical protein
VSQLNLGFLTVLQEASGYLGGYLVTNSWGRPLEFRLSTAVQPNRVQQILYAGTLQPYICADLIGKTLFEKTTVQAQLVLTDREPVLELRRQLEVPVVWLGPRDEALGHRDTMVRPADRQRGAILCHPQFLRDVPAVQALLDSLDPSLDLTEPFVRVREAIAEARKMGVTGRS